MSWITMIGLGWAVFASVLLVPWLIQIRTRNAGTVDVFWAYGTGAMAVWYLFATPQPNQLRALLLAGLALFWSIRLGTHLAKRVFGEEEDGRYAAMRRALGTKANLFHFFFFQLQALWAVLFALPFWAAAQSPRAGLDGFDVAGLLVYIVAIAGEGLSDRQLATFRNDPSNQGKVCRSGLWGRSRHPNYFFEWVHWWSYVFFAWGSPFWWIPLLAAGVMLLFLVKLTGIPYTEQQALRTKGEAYRRYQQETNVFFPGPKRRVESPASGDPT